MYVPIFKVPTTQIEKSDKNLTEAKNVFLAILKRLIGYNFGSEFLNYQLFFLFNKVYRNSK